MPLLKQLEFAFRNTDTLTGRLRRPPLPEGESWGEGDSIPPRPAGRDVDLAVVGQARRLPHFLETTTRLRRVALQSRAGRDFELEATARGLLHMLGAARLARILRVEWNPRLQTAAGRAHFRDKLISLNPRLCDHGAAEIDRTLRHEVAHLLAQLRAGRRRILPHGEEWRDACRDLGIADEVRCHALPFRVKSYPIRFVYRCSNCRRDYPRVRQIKRTVACLACCLAYNRGRFAARFRLQLQESIVLT